jgi:hypothetical protein
MRSAWAASASTCGTSRRRTHNDHRCHEPAIVWRRRHPSSKSRRSVILRGGSMPVSTWTISRTTPGRIVLRSGGRNRNVSSSHNSRYHIADLPNGERAPWSPTGIARRPVRIIVAHRPEEISALHLGYGPRSTTIRCGQVDNADKFDHLSFSLSGITISS